MPIDVDSNGKEETIEIDSRHAKKTTTIQAGPYRLVDDLSHLSTKENSHLLFGDIMNSLNLIRMVFLL